MSKSLSVKDLGGLDRPSEATKPTATKSIPPAQDSVGIAETLGNFAQKASRATALHWYLGINDNGQLSVFTEDVGLPMHEAVKTTLDAIKAQIAKELEPIIAIRSQGIWYDLTDKKNDKMDETTLTGCSVVPTREVIKLWEKLTGLTSQEWGNDLQPSDPEPNSRQAEAQQ